MANENIISCPICNGNLFQPFLICTDFTTTHEKFELKKCATCQFVVTSPRPDALSLGKYYDSEKYISHTGKSSAFFDSIYLFARRFTLRWKTRLINRNKNQSVLDYGCGTGEFLQACREMGWDCYGVEPTEAAKTKAIELTKVHINHDLAELEGRKFDVITLWHVLEHISDLEEKLNALRNSLKENGTLFVAVPNYQAHDAEVYQEYWAGYDVPRHLWHFSQDTMKILLKKTDFKLTEVRPMKLDAYYVSLLSQKYKSSGSTSLEGILKAIFTGFRSNQKAKNKMNYSSLIYISRK
jgi:2-polyprenyl-3-methyl-5-hydroxy-6-metoxy-1,4-benzoquinol methylase